MRQQSEEAAAMNINRTPSEVEEIVVMVRLSLYNQQLPC